MLKEALDNVPARACRCEPNHEARTLWLQAGYAHSGVCRDSIGSTTVPFPASAIKQRTLLLPCPAWLRTI